VCEILVKILNFAKQPAALILQAIFVQSQNTHTRKRAERAIKNRVLVFLLSQLWGVTPVAYTGTLRHD